uniref:Uncharacterized protein n=1 Tax=Sphenodon punctatus TaxID=8508 RepID=A0A8D0GXU8_SPHPU
MAQTTGLSRFLNIPDLDKAVPDMVNCNMLSVTMMTQIVLPQMVARRKGIIINLSSELGRHPAPLAVLYGATKAFVDFFSRGLEAEYRSRGIIVQSVLPLLVSTNMTFNVAPNRFVKSAEDYAREALNTVGLTSRTSGCLSHAIKAFFCDLLLPEWFRLSSFGFKLQTNLWRRMKDTVAVSKRK